MNKRYVVTMEMVVEATNETEATKIATALHEQAHGVSADVVTTIWEQAHEYAEKNQVDLLIHLEEQL